MNKLELVDHIATEAIELTKVSAAAALEAILDGIVKTLKKGEEVRLVGFGTFLVKERAAGKGRNPATGKEIKHRRLEERLRFKPGAAAQGGLSTKSRPRSRLAASRNRPAQRRPSGRFCCMRVVAFNGTTHWSCARSRLAAGRLICHKAGVFEPDRGRLAQLVEHLAYTERVGGSNPSPPTRLRRLFSAALLVNLAAAGVGPSGAAAYADP